MRVVTQRSFGGPEVLEVAEVDPPSPLPTEVVVAVRAAGLNPVEAAIRSGRFPMLGPPPFVLGWDVSGVVSEVVPGVNRFRVGDDVYGMPLFPRSAGGYAELVAAPSRQLARKPRTVDHVHAAALPLVGLTAYQSLVEIADGQGLQRLAELVDAGRLRVHVEHAMPLEDAAKAHALLETGLGGKAVLTP